MKVHKLIILVLDYILFNLKFCKISYVFKIFQRYKVYFFIKYVNNNFFKFNISNPNPIIFDVGGYKGDFSDLILKTIPGAKIFIFEPAYLFYKVLVKKYIDNENIKIFNFALSGHTLKKKISYDDDKSSIYDSSILSPGELVDVISITDFLEQNQIKQVHLIKINIEGDEYDLLNDLINKSKIDVFDQMLIQFHYYKFENYINFKNLRLSILKTHDEYYNLNFVWSKYILKNSLIFENNI
jgi:FkbM family methyltransferase